MDRPVMTAVVALRCGACGASTTTEVPAEVCPGSPFHVHINTSEPLVGSWYSSHHQPGANILGVMKRGGSPQDH